METMRNTFRITQSFEQVFVIVVLFVFVLALLHTLRKCGCFSNTYHCWFLAYVALH